MTVSKTDDIKETYEKIKPEIKSRIKDFNEIWEKGDKRIFDEMVFCLFTPQSKAKVCWETVQELKEDNLLLEGCKENISDNIKKVRFRNNKASYLVGAREKFVDEDISLKEKISQFEDQKEAREWIVDNVKGLGYKEASHFLRNIGKGEKLAILDRHILKNLVELGVIDEEPKTLTKKRYLEIEEKMEEFSAELGIPIHHLDLVLWHEETGHIFK
ncbi:MAG: N-glycosylase/DNA lyase [Candidatus Thermoplasmatota archaeon]|nr:N-glycosylase/DNA lyase [Candidatus Thermoplasmatota archaeon]MBS3789718.1 N-glycosylase/DNA lyase [Candidatus Thermoplasmatota archaeon]